MGFEEEGEEGGYWKFVLAEENAGIWFGVAAAQVHVGGEGLQV